MNKFIPIFVLFPLFIFAQAKVPTKVPFTISLSAEDTAQYSASIKKGNYKDGKINFIANKSNKDISWRIVFDNKNIIAYFESIGYTYTIFDLFEGIKEECEKFIKDNGLIIKEVLNP